MCTHSLLAARAYAEVDLAMVFGGTIAEVMLRCTRSWRRLTYTCSYMNIGICVNTYLHMHIYMSTALNMNIGICVNTYLHAAHLTTHVLAHGSLRLSDTQRPRPK